MNKLKDLISFIEKKGISYEMQTIDEDILQLAFNIEDKEINLYLYEETHIKFFVPLGIHIKEINVVEVLEKINTINIEEEEITLSLLGDNNIYVTKSVIFVSKVDGEKIFSLIEEIVNKIEKLVSKFNQL